MAISNEELALDQVAKMCRDLTDHYQKAARTAHQPQVAELLTELANSRQRLQVQIEEQIRAMGHLPADDDADREFVERLATRFKSLLRGDAALLEDSMHYEGEFAARVEVALSLHLPAPAVLLLQQMAEETVTTRGRLAAAQNELDDT
jgi:hypothetical protein